MVVDVKDDNLWIATSKAMFEILQTEEKLKDFVITSLPGEVFPVKIDQDDRMFFLVKVVIDEFDPFVLIPGGIPNEYDGESRRISEKIKSGMSKEEIADIITDEFNMSFGQDFTREESMWPAKYIYNFINED